MDERLSALDESTRPEMHRLLESCGTRCKPLCSWSRTISEAVYSETDFDYYPARAHWYGNRDALPTT